MASRTEAASSNWWTVSRGEAIQKKRRGHHGGITIVFGEPAPAVGRTPIAFPGRPVRATGGGEKLTGQGRGREAIRQGGKYDASKEVRGCIREGFGRARLVGEGRASRGIRTPPKTESLMRKKGIRGKDGTSSRGVYPRRETGLK